MNSCDDDNDALTIATSISVAMTDNELLNDALTILIIDADIEELNVVILSLLADIDVAIDELKLAIDATLPLKVDAIEELIEEDINNWDAEIDELIIDTSKSVAMVDRELLSEELTVLIIVSVKEELKALIVPLIEELNWVWEARLALNDVATEELNVICDALLALNDVATDELKSPVILAILALLALNDVATEALNVLMLPVKLIAVLPSPPNKYKVPLPLS